MLCKSLESSDYSASEAYNDFFAEWITDFKEAILEIAEEEKKPVSLEEIQLHSEDGKMGRRRIHDACKKDVIISMDPNIHTWGLIAGFMENTPEKLLS